MDYLYDGSFEGLLTAIYLNYYEEKALGIYPEANYQYAILTPYKVVQTDSLQAAKVYEAVENKISRETLRLIYYVYLSSHPRKENLILTYVELGFKLGAKIDGYHTHSDVFPIAATARKVSLETHRFLGLLRFSEAKGFLYAVFEPDHNILVLMAEHFSDRLAGENFIIHDRKRNLAVIYDQKEWVLTDFQVDKDFQITDSEAFYQGLWTAYFNHIAIDNRKNKKLQAHFIPQRYRHNLVEFVKSFPP
ncbi:MAG: hypothetical protein AWM53_01323 [Candidatus Dichloromethanomonas elyunquensis]|nr:MAG: hypothetical protein AWM53_01323 [Candidatus Dichloromethanomonas elyunquensis]